jgi:pyridoxamine 5'-phosphate oxidase
MKVDNQPYTRGQLRRGDLLPHPIDQFTKWYQAALETDGPEPNAMTLATASPGGIPSARMVLLKGFDESGFQFYTNYESQKGRELLANSNAALVFFWKMAERQVRIVGAVEALSEEVSTAYFHSRPRSSQIGAWVSRQSTVIPNRAHLTSRLSDLQQQFANVDLIPKPPYWGGFLLRPRIVEFWQGGEARLHDRFCYTRTGDGWHIERLSP